MMIKVCVFLILLSASEKTNSILPINMPRIPEGESRELQVTVSYGGKMSPTQVLEFGEAAKRVRTQAHWEGDGPARHLVYTRTEQLNNDCQFKHVFTFLPGKLFKMKHYENVLIEPGGEIVQREFYNFNAKSAKYPEIMAHPFTLDLAFRTFNLEKGARRSLNLWLSATTVFKMETLITGIEEITLPDGEKAKCYRLEMIPDFTDVYGAFVNRIIRPLVPEFTFWIKSEAPHIIIKYTGPLGQVSPAGGPTETQELIKYHPGKSG